MSAITVAETAFTDVLGVDGHDVRPSPEDRIIGDWVFESVVLVEEVAQGPPSPRSGRRFA